MSEAGLGAELRVLTAGFERAHGDDAAAMVELLAALGGSSDEKAALRLAAAQLRTVRSANGGGCAPTIGSAGS